MVACARRSCPRVILQPGSPPEVILVVKGGKELAFFCILVYVGNFLSLFSILGHLS